ncbi:MAG TPA: ChbG/HpnK family deacetylase, partial [Gammaproteobacteria bacterium]|nr:ChbG/HpnK family deacetylase [Gammaproteobacteria bacterium]
MQPAKRSLILCADDFALDEAVSEGILRLVEARRVSAVSCFADAPSWPEAGARLRDLSGREIALGLHFNLTERFGFGERPLGYWIAAGVLRAVNARAIGRHLQRQIERFREIAGRLPAFIDGHQHVHAFPVVRDAVAAAAAEAAPRPIPLRDVRRFFGP